MYENNIGVIGMGAYIEYAILFFILLVGLIIFFRLLFMDREDYGGMLDTLKSTDDNCLGRL